MAHQSVSQCRFYVNVMEWLSLNNAIAITKDWIKIGDIVSASIENGLTVNI